MSAKRVIPCLDVNKGRVVKGVNFVNLKDAGDPVELAARYDKEGADELVFLDITASNEGRETTYDMVKKVAEVVSIPFTVGGGIKTIEDIQKILDAGADKVSLGTAAVKDETLMEAAAKHFGSQCIVAAVDARATGENQWEVYINGGQVATGIDVLDWVKRVEELGAGEILLTSMDRDGTKDGYDVELTRRVREAVNIPVTASGGAGLIEHFGEAVLEGKADAVLAASLFHYGTYSVGQVKEYLKSQGVAVNG
jgi:cyclase